MDAHPEVGLTHGMGITTDRPDPERDALVVTPDVEVCSGLDYIRRVCDVFAGHEMNLLGRWAALPTFLSRPRPRVIRAG